MPSSSICTKSTVRIWQLLDLFPSVVLNNLWALRGAQTYSFLLECPTNLSPWPTLPQNYPSVFMKVIRGCFILIADLIVKWASLPGEFSCVGYVFQR